MAAAAEMIEEQPFDILDINMGCPVPKIVNNQEGSALMKDPALIEKLVDACVKHTSRPVTVKLRTGYDHAHQNVVDCAKAAEAGGASMIAVHGRTRPQMYAGETDWSKIAEVVQAVSIPVVGNGDVTDGPSAKRMLEETGCTAVMIGRASEGNPWIFREVVHYLETGEELPRESFEWYLDVLREEVLNSVARLDERRGIIHIRRHLAATPLFKGIPNFRETRIAMLRTESVEELFRIFDGLTTE